MARQLVIELVGESRKLTKALGEADRATSSFGDKVQGAGRKMTAFVSVPIIGFLGLSAKAAMEDAAEQSKLAKILENTTAATDKQVAAVEAQLEKMMKVSTFTDSELRPAFSRLVTSTKDADEATKLLTTAMDISAATGRPLQTVTDALAKAHDGQSGALSRLGIAVKDASGETLSFEEIMRNANETFGGSAQAAAETTAGKMQNLKRDIGELSEKIGGDLMPAFTKIGGFLVDTLIPTLDGLTGNNGALMLMGVAMAGPILANVNKLILGLKGIQTAALALTKNPAVMLVIGAAMLVSGQGKGKQTGTLIQTLTDWLTPFQEGGVIPGPAGKPMPILAHGGETVIPAGRRAGGSSVTNIVVHVAGSVVTERQLVDAVHNGLLSKQRRGGPLGFEAA